MAGGFQLGLAPQITAPLVKPRGTYLGRHTLKSKYPPSRSETIKKGGFCACVLVVFCFCFGFLGGAVSNFTAQLKSAMRLAFFPILLVNAPQPHSHIFAAAMAIALIFILYASFSAFSFTFMNAFHSSYCTFGWVLEANVRVFPFFLACSPLILTPTGFVVAPVFRQLRTKWEA